MNTFIRIIVALCGIALLLPGLCTVYFGGAFALSGFSGHDMYGMGVLSIPWLIVVHAEQLRTRGRRADRLRELADLLPGGEVAAEQNHPGAGRVLQPVTLFRSQHLARNSNHQHPTCPVGAALAASVLLVSPLRVEVAAEAAPTGAARWVRSSEW